MDGVVVGFLACGLEFREETDSCGQAFGYRVFFDVADVFMDLVEV